MSASGSAPSCLLTFDIEEWFQVENMRAVFPRTGWDTVPRRVVASTRAILDLLAERRRPATFFVLGWVAEREPALVREIAAHGHEIAAHGYGHARPTQIPLAEFREDVLRARGLLEELSGQPVVGYRAPSFSLAHDHLSVLRECGFRYDSSFHPFSLHDRYGRLDNLGPPVRPGVYSIDGEMIELALPVERIGPLQLPVSGGGYFRLYPGAVFRRLVRRVLMRDGHYTMYLHSWEFDAHMPRVKVPGLGYAFRHYNNLDRTLPRMRQLLRMLEASGAAFTTVAAFVDAVRRTLPSARARADGRPSLTLAGRASAADA